MVFLCVCVFLQYVLEVKADDGLFNAKCSVEIKITNVNDEYPQFTKMHQEARIVEGDLVSGCIATVSILSLFVYFEVAHLSIM